MYVKLGPAADKNLDIKVLVVNVLYGYFINQNNIDSDTT